MSGNTERRVILAVIFLIFAAALLLGTGRPAHCGDCDTLKQPDERHLCRAVTQCLKSECEFIKDADARQVCRVRVREQCHK